jgi:cytochrome c553
MKTSNTAPQGVILPGATLRGLARSLLALLLASPPVALLAEGTPAAGQAKAKVCEACHGLDGKSIAPNYPHLAGQHEDYLVKALADYRAGRRTNPIMAPMAANLSDQDIEDLAAWYASQEGLKDLSIR